MTMSVNMTVIVTITVTVNVIINMTVAITPCKSSSPLSRQTASCVAELLTSVP